MKIFDKIQELLNKWLSFMTIEDQKSMTILIDELYTEKSKTKNEINIKKQEIENIESIRTLELKEEKGEDGKKKYTEAHIDSIISQELKDHKTQQNLLTYTLDQIEGKIKVCELYRIDIRDSLKLPIYQDNNGEAI